MKVIVTGTTGMVGQGILREALADPDIKSVLSLSRAPIALQDPKLTAMLVPDFYNLAALEPALTGYDACLHGLGVSAVGMSEEAYTRVTYDLTLHLAQTLLRLNPGMSFCYVSGQGTDEAERSRQMWARVKGRTENALLALPFKHVHMFRPGFIEPGPGILAKTAWYRWLYRLLWPFFGLFRLMPGLATTSGKLGRAMIRAARGGYEDAVLGNRDINRLGA